MDLVVGRDVGGPVPLQAGDDLVGRQPEVRAQLGLHDAPSFQKRGLTLRARSAMSSPFSPTAPSVGELGLVAGLAAAIDLGGDQDVRSQLPRQLVAGRLP